MPGRTPDSAVLERGKGYLGEPTLVTQFGPYPAYTDVADTELHAFLDRLAVQMEVVYRTRYGLDLRGRAEEVVLLFSDGDSFREFRSSHESGIVDPAGYSGFGIVATYRGDRSRGEVGSTLVHELAHLLNRRGLGPALPPWLNEGMADDLAQSRVDVNGRIQPGVVGGRVVKRGNRIHMLGGQASLQHLVRALDEESFSRGEHAELNYAHSSFFIRYLLSGREAGLEGRFRDYLEDVASGGRWEPAALLEHLGRDWVELEGGFSSWLNELAAESEPA